MEVIKPEKLAEMIVANLADKSDVVGCTEAQIQDLETKYAIKLPAAYKDFLRAFGNSAQEVFGDVELMYPDLLTYYEYDGILKYSTDKFTLPANAFIFASRLDTLAFSITTDGDDPPVYRYISQQDAEEKIYPSFSEWLTDYVLTEIKLQKDIDEFKRERLERESKLQS